MIQGVFLALYSRFGAIPRRVAARVQKLIRQAYARIDLQEECLVNDACGASTVPMHHTEPCQVRGFGFGMGRPRISNTLTLTI